MEDSHRHLAITPGEWQAFMDDVQATLDKFSVPAAEQAEVKALVESTRTAIVVSGAERLESSEMTNSSSLGQDSAAITP
jgi:hemoglobin